MTYKPYWERLRDPRWQKRRLEVMEAAEWKCRSCDSADKTLNVHHRYYIKGRQPWEYDDDALVCLCEDCHEKTSELLAEATRIIGSLDAGSLEEAVGYLRGLLWMCGPGDFNAELECRSAETAYGLCAAFGIVGTKNEEGMNTLAEALGGKVPAGIMIDASHKMRRAVADVELT